MKFNSTLPERFAAKVIKGDGCWRWSAKKNNAGYGMIRPTNSQKDGFELAHRVSWVLAHGPIPEGMLVLHACDNPECTNPAHLWLGTHGDNSRDMMQKGRRPYDEWLAKTREAAVRRRKVSAEQAREVRALHAAGMPLRALARRFNVGRRGIICWLRTAG